MLTQGQGRLDPALIRFGVGHLSADRGDSNTGEACSAVNESRKKKLHTKNNLECMEQNFLDVRTELIHTSSTKNYIIIYSMYSSRQGYNKVHY